MVFRNATLCSWNTEGKNLLNTDSLTHTILIAHIGIYYINSPEYFSYMSSAVSVINVFNNQKVFGELYYLKPLMFADKNIDEFKSNCELEIIKMMEKSFFLGLMGGIKYISVIIPVLSK